MGASASRPNEPYNPYAPSQYAVHPITATYSNSKALKKSRDSGSNVYSPQYPYPAPYPAPQYPIAFQNGQPGYYIYPPQISGAAQQTPIFTPQNSQSPQIGTPVADVYRRRSTSNEDRVESAGGVQGAESPTISQPTPTPVEPSAHPPRSGSPLANPLPEPPQPVPIPGEFSGGLRDRSPMRRHSDSEERTRQPLERPLPALPKDIYETEQYRSLTEGPGAMTGGTIQVYPEGWFEKREFRKKPRGILRSFSTNDPTRPAVPQRHESAPEPRRDAFSERSSHRSQRLHRTTSELQSSPQGILRSPVPYVPPVRMPHLGPPPPPITFDKQSGLSHISRHRILYKDKLYPTAFHLLEAYRFLGHRNDLAERIREAESVRDVYTMSAALNKQARPDWADIILNKMDDVQCMKFRQHPDLRNQLLSTGTADLIFADRSDPFWGDGPLGHGSNELGKSLVRVREKLLYGDIKEEKKWSSMFTKLLG